MFLCFFFFSLSLFYVISSLSFFYVKASNFLLKKPNVQWYQCYAHWCSKATLFNPPPTGNSSLYFKLVILAMALWQPLMAPGALVSRRFVGFLVELGE